MILGLFIAKVGEEEDSSAVGRYGLRERNKRADRLVEFAGQHEMIICNTIFKNQKRRLYTWKKFGRYGKESNRLHNGE